MTENKDESTTYLKPSIEAVETYKAVRDIMRSATLAFVGTLLNTLLLMVMLYFEVVAS